MRENSKQFASDINKNSDIQKNHRKWSKITLKICALIFLLSFSTYVVLKKRIILLTYSTNYDYLDSFDTIDVHSITQFDKLRDTIKNYRKKNEINDDQEIDGIFSVDAVSLIEKSQTPHIKINDDIKVFGVTEEIKIEEPELSKLRILVDEQESLIQN